MKRFEIDPGAYRPNEAERLLSNPAVIREATRISGPGWKPRMMTRSRSGRRLVDALEDVLSVAEIQAWLPELLRTSSPKAFRAELEPVLTLAQREIPKSRERRTDAVPDWTEDLDLGPLSNDPDAKKRPIVIVEPELRAVLNAFALVLYLTSDPLLPKAAKAYRRDHGDLLTKAVMSFAKRVASGSRYALIVDATNCFPTIPWKGVRKALKKMGYTDRFVEMVIILIQAPIEFQKGHVWNRIHTGKGIPAGMAISSPLLNIFFAELDELITSKYRGRVHYDRYSDNFILCSPKKHWLAGAARDIRSWLRKQGMTLKELAAHQKPSEAICDLREGSQVVLGVEVHSDGRTSVPEAEVKERLVEIQHYADKLQRLPRYVAEVSRYQEGLRHRGLDVRDSSDIERMISSTVRWTGDFNTVQAEAFEQAARDIVSTTFDDDLLWVAVVGPPRTLANGVMQNSKRRLDRSLIDDLLDEPHGIFQEGSDPEEEIRVAQERSSLREDLSESSSYDEPHYLMYPHETAKLGEEDESSDLSLNTQRSYPSDSDEDDWVCDGELASLGYTGSGIAEASRDQGCHTPAYTVGQVVAEDGVCKTPAVPLLTQRRTIRIQSRRLRRGSETLVGVEVLDPAPLGATVTRDVVHGSGDEKLAVLNVILRAVDRAALEGVACLVVELADSWLPKALLKHNASVRSVEIGIRIVRLHRKARKHDLVVLLTGPVEMSPSLTSLVDSAARS